VPHCAGLAGNSSIHEGVEVARYIFHRLVSMLPVLLLVSLIVFSLIHLSPGDPVDLILGEERADAEVIAALRADLGLDQPLYVQYLRWLNGLVHGDLGYSFRSRIPVWDAIVQRLPTTIELTVAAMMIALFVSLPLGTIAALHRNTWPDFLNSILASLGASMPNFWLGVLLIYLFAVNLHWLPPSGYISPFKNPWGNLRSMVLPALALSAAYAAVVMRMVRSSLLEVLNEDYVRTARAKGLTEWLVLFRHTMRNALIPIVTIVGMETGRLLGGAVVTETVFALPGVGRLAVDAVLTRDFPIVQAVTLLMTGALLLSNLVVDLLYGFLDPRIHHG
jgi:peptide/nickel transport system permease protein